MKFSIKLELNEKDGIIAILLPASMSYNFAGREAFPNDGAIPYFDNSLLGIVNLTSLLDLSKKELALS